MIVWGGAPDGGGIDLATGGRYDPTTNQWTAITTVGAPAARRWHTAVWTGSEMIVWGGYSSSGSTFLASGGRYDPVNDVWNPLSTSGTPSPRARHTMVWTGSEMIVWGGGAVSFTADGARYNPTNDTWIPIATSNAPEARGFQTGVWTGSKIVVWGGKSGTNSFLSTGGRYDPTSNTWAVTGVSTLGAPTPRWLHTAVWTGAEMIVWGGTNDLAWFDGGARYDPVSDAWSATELANAPSPRARHTSVWTGSEMIAWGGATGKTALKTGDRYQPVSNSWSPISNVGAPNESYEHTAVWTGSKMILWGNWPDDGAIYVP